MKDEGSVASAAQQQMGVGGAPRERRDISCVAVACYAWSSGGGAANRQRAEESTSAREQRRREERARARARAGCGSPKAGVPSVRDGAPLPRVSHSTMMPAFPAEAKTWSSCQRT
eukprot:3495474-Prymnesium_polylepis.1